MKNLVSSSRFAVKQNLMLRALCDDLSLINSIMHVIDANLQNSAIEPCVFDFDVILNKFFRSLKID